jgi:hypothetical protein
MRVLSAFVSSTMRAAESNEYDPKLRKPFLLAAYLEGYVLAKVHISRNLQAFQLQDAGN